MKSAKELEKLFDVDEESLKAMEMQAAAGVLPGKPAGETLRGPGRPKLSDDDTELLSVKLPAGMKAQLAKRAASDGVAVSAYVRRVLADSLAKGA